jgi:hypothetical protein
VDTSEASDTKDLIKGGMNIRRHVEAERKRSAKFRKESPRRRTIHQHMSDVLRDLATHWASFLRRIPVRKTQAPMKWESIEKGETMNHYRVRVARKKGHHLEGAEHDPDIHTATKARRYPFPDGGSSFAVKGQTNG